ncbi:hypothetical protein Tco_0626860 [Tanacetum coccineum]|uniref:Uncharacterized protein n=1 Tax=Tanacetum coccineum TaxID=301880 RepID=A0ABQ4WL20_9ASTR
MTEKETNDESVPKNSYDPSQSGEDRMKLHELMNLCTKLYDRVLTLETTKTTQALEIASLKSRVKKLEKKASKRTHKFKRLYRVGTTRRVESSNDEGLGAQEYASKQRRSIEDINKDAEVSLVDETQGSAAETLTTTGIKIPVSTVAPSTIVVSPLVISEVEITLAQTLVELKNAKSKVVIQEPVQSTVTTAPSTILKAKGITFRDAGETTIRTPTLLARRLDAEEQEAARLERENIELQEQATLAKIEEWDNVQAMMDVDYELCKRLHEQDQGFTYNQLKNKSYEEIQKDFDKTMGWINNFKPMDSEEVKSSEKKAEGSRKKSIGKKRVGNEQKQESSKRQRMKDDKETDEHEEVEEDDESEMKKHMEIVQDKEEIAINVIPLATKPPMIFEYKIVKEGQEGFYHLIRAYRSSKRYSLMIKMLQNIDREDLETLWMLVKAKHGNTRPEDDYERVFWGDLKVMFEPEIKSEV